MLFRSNYNGPQVPARNKWSEVQIQVRRKAKDGAVRSAPATPHAADTAPAAPATPSDRPAPVTPPAA